MIRLGPREKVGCGALDQSRPPQEEHIEKPQLESCYKVMDAGGASGCSVHRSCNQDWPSFGGPAGGGT